MKNITVVTHYLTRAGVYSTIAACFFVPLSTSFMGLFGALILFFWLASGSADQLPRILRESPVAVISVLLILLFIAGIFYSPASWEEARDCFKKYRELFFIPAIMCLLAKDQQGSAQWAVTSFFIGCIVVMLTSYAMAAGFIASERYGYSVTYHITHSFFMAILAFWAGQKVMDARKYRWLWIILLLAVTGNIVYIAPGRTGMITFLLLALLFLWQRLPWRKLMFGLVVFVLLSALAAVSSKNIQTRLHDAYDDIQTYEQGVSRSSLGMRFDWWFNCLRLVKEKPLLGHGTGSFTQEHDRLIEGTETKATDNPHNEYLFIAVQLGILGLLAFVGLFVAAWHSSLHLVSAKRRLVQGVILSMASGCLMNSFLFDSHQGHYFAFLTALLLAPRLTAAGNTQTGSARNETRRE